MDDLFLFIRESSADLALAGNAALMGALPPGPRSLSLWANGPRHDMRHAAAGLLALWHRPPLRLPSGRAVSCVRRAILTCEALGASHFSQSKSKIRFCSGSLSGFAPALSGFAPAPTGHSSSAGRFENCCNKSMHSKPRMNTKRESYWLFVTGYWERERKSRFFKERGHPADLFNFR